MGLGLGALAAAAGFAFKQFEDAEKIQSQTAAALKSTGGAANVTAKQVEGLAQAVSKKTGIDDEAIQTGENLLLTFTRIRNEVGKGNDIFNRATSTIVDMSAALDQDLKSSAIQVGKALNDPIIGLTALRRVGVAFTEQQADQIKALVESGDQLTAQKLILKELTTEFGGSAEAQKTATGVMMTSLGNLAEVIGEVLAPAVTALVDGLTIAAEWLQAHLQPALAATSAWFERVWKKIGPVVTRLRDELGEALEQSWHVIRDRVWPALQDLWRAFQEVWKTLGPLIGLLVKLALEVLPAVVFALSVLIKWWSIQIQVFGKIIGAIKDVILWLKDRFIAAWNAVKGPVMAVVNAILGGIELLIRGLERVIGLINQLNAKEMAHDISTVPGTVNPTAPFAPNAPHASGGWFHPGPMLVGEHGPEVVVPNFSGTVVPNGGFNIRVYVGEREVRDIVVRGLREAMARA